MRAIVVTVGNPLRRDDGVAHQLLKHLDCESRSAIQLTPEMAETIAGYETVVFADADAVCHEPQIEPVEEFAPCSAFTHLSSAQSIVALSRALFGFDGRAFLCRIPAADLSCGAGLSPGAAAAAAQAAELLRPLVSPR